MDVALMILKTVDLPISYSVADSEERMSQILLFPSYSFVSHFKSTTPYIQVYCRVFQHYRPIEADIPLFINDKNIWKK